MKKKVLIVYGGESVEHDISIITALQVMMFLPKEYDFVPVYIDRKNVWWTADNLDDKNVYTNFDKNVKKKRQVFLVNGEKVLYVKKKNHLFPMCEVLSVLNCCHGRFGEDGCLQGVLAGCDIPQTSPGVTTSAICMDKAFLKDVMFHAGIDTPQYVCICKDEVEKTDFSKIVRKMKFPLVVKPANLGSSIGVSVCKDEKELETAGSFAFEFDRKVIVEECICNLREFNCAVFEYRKNVFCSDVSEVTQMGEVYSFADKYLSSATFDKKVEKRLEKKIKSVSERAYKIMGCGGVVRIDFLYDEKERKLFLNEINTIPGALAFYLFKDIKFSELIKCLIEESIARNEREKTFVKTYKSDALKVFREAEIRRKK